MVFLKDESANGLVEPFDKLFGYNLVLTLALETQNRLFELLEEKTVESYTSFFNGLLLRENAVLTQEEESLLCAFAESIGKIYTVISSWNPSGLMNTGLEHLQAKGRFCQRIGLTILKELINEKTNLDKETVERVYKIIEASKPTVKTSCSFVIFQNIPLFFCLNLHYSQSLCCEDFSHCVMVPLCHCVLWIVTLYTGIVDLWQFNLGVELT